MQGYRSRKAKQHCWWAENDPVTWGKAEVEKAGRATAYLFPPPRKYLSALKPKHPDKRASGGIKRSPHPDLFMSFIHPVGVSYAQSPWEPAKLQLQTPLQPRTQFYAGLWHGLILLQEPIYQKQPLLFPLLVTPYPPYSRDNSASYSRVNTKEIAGTKKDRGQNFIGFGVLFAVTQNGCRRKNPIKLMRSEQSPESTGRRQRKDRGIVSTITTALRTGGHLQTCCKYGEKMRFSRCYSITQNLCSVFLIEKRVSQISLLTSINYQCEHTPLLHKVPRNQVTIFLSEHT